MAHAIQFLTFALKDVPTNICDSQIAAIEAARAIFTNGETIKPIQTKTTRAPLIPRQAAPERYRTPTSKGDQDNQPAILSKSALQQTVDTITKKIKKKINSVDDQEPIAKSTRSRRSIAQLQPTQKIQGKSEYCS